MSNTDSEDGRDAPVNIMGLNGRPFQVAITLARKGRYNEASKSLQSALVAGECTEAEALDLQARIYSQQGLYLKAESCWVKANALDKTNPAYERALAWLRRPRFPTNIILRPALALGAVLFVVFLLVGISQIKSMLARRLETDRAAIASLSADMTVLNGRAQSTLSELAAQSKEFESRLNSVAAAVSNANNSVQSSETAIIQQIATRDSEVAKRLVALDNSVDRELKTRASAADIATLTKAMTAMDKRFEVVPDVVRNELKPVATSAEIATLAKALVGLERRLEAMEGSVTQNLKPLASSGAIEALGKNISAMEKQLIQIENAMKLLNNAPFKNLLPNTPTHPALPPDERAQ